ncbi:hypothetical protein CYLTODRAFT_425809 [Cylindrobasidium torrendii FP15055 ss-10]|uniref:Uncharacterized protein n=1 Tax=Cylindrobasidium torrendii FP15055 ss-10 TaxID=1314674 RepID=A0A0D7B2M6_9AGAR|nr:hypothetical protein CYLTODRAFT_425809 [Cylindrobasidium torrendii FP15055 ss-10]
MASGVGIENVPLLSLHREHLALEACPRCSSKAVVDVRTQFLQCVGTDCGIVSYRDCKRTVVSRHYLRCLAFILRRRILPAHVKVGASPLPFCGMNNPGLFRAEKALMRQHAIEEAKTAAFVRHCPGCSRAFIKEGGCNKMTCIHCMTISCYVCRQELVGNEKFSHFDPYSGSSEETCSMGDDPDDLERRRAHEVAILLDAVEHPVLDSDPEVDLCDARTDVDAARRPALHALADASESIARAIMMRVPSWGTVKTALRWMFSGVLVSFAAALLLIAHHVVLTSTEVLFWSLILPVFLPHPELQKDGTFLPGSWESL